MAAAADFDLATARPARGPARFRLVEERGFNATYVVNPKPRLLGSGSFGSVYHVKLSRPMAWEIHSAPTHELAVRIEVADINEVRRRDDTSAAYQYAYLAAELSELAHAGYQLTPRVFDTYVVYTPPAAGGASSAHQLRQLVRQAFPEVEREIDAFSSGACLVCTELELFELGDMSHHMESAYLNSEVPPHTWRRWMAVLLYQLYVVHEHLGVVHLDLKVTNILMARFDPRRHHPNGIVLVAPNGERWLVPFSDGEAVPIIVDFGCARRTAVLSNLCMGSYAIGNAWAQPPMLAAFGDVGITTSTMFEEGAAPAQRIRPAGFHNDVWGLGMMMYAVAGWATTLGDPRSGQFVRGQMFHHPMQALKATASGRELFSVLEGFMQRGERLVKDLTYTVTGQYASHRYAPMMCEKHERETLITAIIMFCALSEMFPSHPPEDGYERQGTYHRLFEKWLVSPEGDYHERRQLIEACVSVMKDFQSGGEDVHPTEQEAMQAMHRRILLRQMLSLSPDQRMFAFERNMPITQEQRVLFTGGGESQACLRLLRSPLFTDFVMPRHDAMVASSSFVPGDYTNTPLCKAFCERPTMQLSKAMDSLKL